MPSRFAELLRNHRLSRGLSQEALAEVSGVSVSSIGTYERGLHSAHRETVAMLAAALQLRGTTRAEFEIAARRAPRGAVEESRDDVRGNLPSPVTSFVGRELEISRTAELLRRHRIVTLTGSGGIGKTRLALHTVSRLRSEYPDGLWFIDFSAIVEPALVLSRLALALEIPFAGNGDASDLVAQFAQRAQLLIFDNCEHLVKPIADLAATILRNTKKTTILATSRERLRITGEAVSRVPTLAIPTAVVETPGEARSYSAIALFSERAQTVVPEFDLTAERVEAVIAICSRLEGIPLAIELAAARLPSLGLRQLRDKLSDRFAALSIGPRDLAPRQQTLLATIAWSYDLLDEPEQSVLKALSSFPAGFTLLAGAAVADPGLAEAVIGDLISALADKSFLTIESFDAVSGRYVMLESTRDYVRRMRSTDEVEINAFRFAEWCASFADSCERNRFAMSLEAWTDMVRPEFESISAALDWALKDAGRALTAGRIIAGVRAYWLAIGRNDELARLASDLLTKILAKDYRSIAARLIFCTYHLLPDYAEREASLIFARTLLESREDRHGLMLCNLYLAHCLIEDKPIESLRAAEEAERLAKLLRLPRVLLDISVIRVRVLVHVGRHVEAKDSVLEIIQQSEAQGEVAGTIRAKMILAALEFNSGDAERAAQIATDVVAVMGTEVAASERGVTLSALSIYLAVVGRDEEARNAARAVLLAASLRDHMYLTRVILSIALIAVRQRRIANAARLFGFFKANDYLSFEKHNRSGQVCSDMIVASLNEAFSAQELEAHIVAGGQLSKTAAIEEALIV